MNDKGMGKIEMCELSVKNIMKAYASTDKRNWFDSFIKDFGSYDLMRNGMIDNVVCLYKEELIRRGTCTTESIRTMCSRLKKNINDDAANLISVVGRYKV